MVSEGKQRPWRRLSPGIWAACLLTLLPVCFYWSVVIRPRRHIPFDLVGFHLPLISYVEQCFRQGIAPLWNPYPYCGVPIHADIQAQVFYPLNWLSILASSFSDGRNLLYWVEWLAPLHMIIAGLFTYWFLRRLGSGRPAALMGAAIYQLGGYFASQAQHLGGVCSAAWFPPAMLATWELRERIRARWIGLLAISVGMSILSGFVANTLVFGGAAAMLAAALLISRKASWRIMPGVAAGFLLGAAISAVTLIPFWQLTGVSMAGARGDWYFNPGGMPLESLVSLVIPNYYHLRQFSEHELPFNFTQAYAYLGIATVALLLAAPFARKSMARLFLALTVLSAVWMLGGHTPVLSTIYPHLPALVRGSLYCEQALMAFCGFGAIAAALALDRLGRRLPQAVLWGIALFTCADLIWAGSRHPMNSMPQGYDVIDSEYRVPNAPGLPAQLQKLVNQSQPPARIDYTDTTFTQGVRGPEMIRVPTPSGDNPSVLMRILELRRLYAKGNFWERLLVVEHLDSPLLDMVGANYVIGVTPIPEAGAAKAGLERVEPIGPLQVYRNPGAVPRFHLVPRIVASSGRAGSLRKLAEPDFNASTEAIVERAPKQRNGLGQGSVSVVRYEPNRVELAVNASAPGFLVTSEVMYPGWKASVNGKPATLYMTNGAFRGLRVPAGASTVVMRYWPRYFTVWILISLSALATAGFFIVRGKE